MSQAPRIDHNWKLCNAAIEEMKVTCRYPKVTSQAEVFPIEPRHLVRFGYNPSIVEDNGGITLAYRFHDGDTLQTRLALAQIAWDGKVHSNRALPSKNGTSMEDPRLFWHENKLYISWVESNYPNTPLTSVVKYGQLQDGVIVSEQFPKINNPKPMEKNWVPFSAVGVINFIYCLWPEQRILQVIDSNVCHTLVSPGLRWPWGEPRGGTAPMPYKGKLLRFFHSGADNEYASVRRRYFVGASLMEAEPPFQTLACSSEPILCGSEVDDVPFSEWKKCNHRKSNVVFPLGAIARPDHWLLSVGINDYQISILKIKESDLHL